MNGKVHSASLRTNDNTYFPMIFGPPNKYHTAILTVVYQYNTVDARSFYHIYSWRGKYNHRGKYTTAPYAAVFSVLKNNFCLFSFFGVNFKQICTRNKKKKFEKEISYWLKRCFKKKFFF
jgi:hypothetical protein